MQLSKPRIVIIGAGFGGLKLAKSLRNTKFEVILIDKNNHHLFQPLLYQVATAGLSPGDIAQAIRTELRSNKNIQVIKDEVISIDKINKTISLKKGQLDFDYLVLAPGNQPFYFKKEWEEYAPGLKNLYDAVKMREKILNSFDLAERNYKNTELYKKYTRFVIVGGGPTGVELAGAISEIARKTILKDYPLINEKDIEIYLIEGAAHLLNSYDDSLSEYTKDTLESMGVQVLTNTFVKNINENGVEIEGKIINAANVIWAAGNIASPLLKTLDIELDKLGRAIINKDLSIPNYENIFVIGDAAAYQDKEGRYLPGIAQVAIQMGVFLSKQFKNINDSEKRKKAKFEYNDKGNMATIGRAKAIFQKNNFKLKGFSAWFLWGIIHIFFLIDFRNRLKVMLEWFWYYVTFKPGANIIFHNLENEKKK